MSYFELFGKNGFHECQVVIPESGFRSFVEGVRDFLKRTRIPISLASAKLFRGERELLRFTGNGICLALDFPRTSGSAAFGAFLDDLVRQHGAWPNLIKDSRLSNEVVRDTYPGYEAFRKALREFDPKRLYRSELSERLGL